MLQHLSAQQLPAFGQGAALSLSAEQTLRIITPKMENPGTVTCGTVTSDRGKEKAEERKMYGTVFLLITPPCCKKALLGEMLQQQVTAPEYEWGRWNLCVALCKWILAFWLWFAVTGVFCS